VYGTVRSDLHRESLVRLQPVSTLSGQLNVLRAVLQCASSVRTTLQTIETHLGAPADWSAINQEWKDHKSELQCVAGTNLRRTSTSKEAISQPSDRDVSDALDDALAKVGSSVNNLSSAIQQRNQAETIASSRTLGNQLLLFHVVAAIQVDKLSRDFNQLASIYKGSAEPDSPSLVPDLRKLIQNWPQ
jgi:hypothetical protein